MSILENVKTSSTQYLNRLKVFFYFFKFLQVVKRAIKFCWWCLLPVSACTATASSAFTALLMEFILCGMGKQWCNSNKHQNQRQG